MSDGTRQGDGPTEMEKAESTTAANSFSGGRGKRTHEKFMRLWDPQGTGGVGARRLRGGRDH